MMESTEQLVIEQLKCGNEEAYRYLYRHHYVVLCHTARGYVDDAAVAEQLVGDVIFHLWEVHESLDIRISLRSYLIRAVRNRCLDYLDSQKQKNEIPFSKLGDGESLEGRYISSEDYPLGILLERELEHEIRSAIRHLPEECRRVFVKSRFEEKKYEEIARELGISVNTVKYHMKSALARLYAELSKYMLLLQIFILSGCLEKFLFSTTHPLDFIV